MDKAKEILTKWLTQVDSTHIKEGHITVILNAMEEYAELVNKTNDIHSVSGTYSKEDMEKSFDKGGDWRIACKNLTDGKISKIEWAENYEDFEEFISNYR